MKISPKSQSQPRVRKKDTLETSRFVALRYLVLENTLSHIPHLRKIVCYHRQITRNNSVKNARWSEEPHKLKKKNLQGGYLGYIVE